MPVDEGSRKRAPGSTVLSARDNLDCFSKNFSENGAVADGGRYLRHWRL